MKNDSHAWVFWVIMLAVAWAYNRDSKAPQTTTAPSLAVESRSSFFGSNEGDDPPSMTRDEAIAQHWDDIKEYLNGTETVEACASGTGCYDLDADITNGTVDTVHFSNGGYRSFSADLDENGDASDIDSDGQNWDIQLDMSSSAVDEAIQEWANANGLTVE